jgi:hypothetical protein
LRGCDSTGVVAAIAIDVTSCSGVACEVVRARSIIWESRKEFWESQPCFSESRLCLMSKNLHVTPEPRAFFLRLPKLFAPLPAEAAPAMVPAKKREKYHRASTHKKSAEIQRHVDRLRCRDAHANRRGIDAFRNDHQDFTNISSLHGLHRSSRSNRLAPLVEGDLRHGSIRGPGSKKSFRRDP